MTEVKKVTVSLVAQPYDIFIGPGLLHQAGEQLSRVLSGKKICIVTDEHVRPLYLSTLTRSLEIIGFVVLPPIVVPAGESTKDFKNLQFVVEEALQRKMDRSSALVALGGGVIGDLAGFAASVIMRGIPFVQIPTTLLAQVDSSVGGKTGINTAQGKNLAGAFYQPKIVLIDTDVLKTLPPREMKAGYAEILKYALINDTAFFSWLEEHGEKLLAGDAAALSHAIAVSCRAKAAIVAEDEREEKDIRALLNLGHTFGHALETIGGYDGRLLHGEAVGIGMLLAARFSGDAGVAARIEKHLQRLGLMTQPPFAVTASDMLSKMRGDKKAKDGKMALVLLKGIGHAYVARDIDAARLEKFLEEMFP